MSNICIIPARGGSKRFPRKNLANFNGLPLICHSVTTALNSGVFDEIYVSSDDSSILAVIDHHPKVRLHQRDKMLATDSAKTIDVVLDLLNHLSISPHTVTLLLPTCPLCLPSHIQEGMQLFHNISDIDAVVSSTPAEFPPQLMYSINPNNIISLKPDHDLVTGNTRSQDHPPMYRPNGAFYISKYQSLIHFRSFWRGLVCAYVMDRKFSVDIDTQIDYEIAKSISQTIDYN